MRSPFGGRLRRAAYLPTMLISGGLMVVPAVTPMAGGVATLARAENQVSVLKASIDRAQTRVAYGKHVVVAGKVKPAQTGREVFLERSTSAGWRVVARTETRARGRYRFRVRATSTRKFRVLVIGGEASPPVKMRVRALIAARTRPANIWTGRSVRISGVLRPANPGRSVQIQRGSGKGWRTIASVKVRNGGHFKAKWKPGSAGVYPLRVRFGGDEKNARTVRQIRRVKVFRPGGASYYSMGGRTACGNQLGAGTIGVAHKTLPCGKRVTLFYRGRTARVPVIDRGPFVAGREWDLTVATKRALGFGSTGTIGAAY